MTTDFDTFNESTMHDFIESPLHERNSEFFGDLVVGGEDFSVEDGSGIAVWDDDNETWLDFGTFGTSGAASQEIFTMISFKGKLYVGGAFTEVDDDSTLRFAVKWDNTTAKWTLMGNTDDINGQVREFFISGNQLIVRGAFTKGTGSIADGLVEYNPATNTFNDKFRRIAQAGQNGGMDIFEGQLYASALGSNWNSINNPDFFRGIGRLEDSKWADVDGSIDTTSSGNRGEDCLVYKNELYLCGLFTKIGSIPTLASSIARWDGKVWKKLSIGITGANRQAEYMTIHKGDLIVSGLFQIAGGIAVQRIAGWNGASWFKLGTNPVRAEAYQSINYKDRLMSGGRGQVFEWTKATQTWRTLSDEGTKKLEAGVTKPRVYALAHHIGLKASLP